MNTEKNKPVVVVDQHRKAGRPTKYEPETIERLLVGLADGLPIKSACMIAGIGVSTLADWREKYPELRHVGRCRDCQEANWWAEGYEITEHGTPVAWDSSHTREEPIAERTHHQLQKAARYRAHAWGPPSPNFR
jgi:hypothetical protein